MAIVIFDENNGIKKFPSINGYIYINAFIRNRSIRLQKF